MYDKDDIRGFFEVKVNVYEKVIKLGPSGCPDRNLFTVVVLIRTLKQITWNSRHLNLDLHTKLVLVGAAFVSAATLPFIIIR